MANGSVGGGGGSWGSGNSTPAAKRTARRLSQSERRVYNTLREQGLSDRQARRAIKSMRSVRESDIVI